MDKLIEQLKRHEGVKLKPYRCTAGKLTVGIGRNIEDNGISMGEAEILLRNDINNSYKELSSLFSWFDPLDNVRKDAMLNMHFNMGTPTLLKFKKSLAYMAIKDYDNAADEFLNSRWAKMVGNRAIEVTSQIRTGEYQDV